MAILPPIRRTPRSVAPLTLPRRAGVALLLLAGMLAPALAGAQQPARTPDVHFVPTPMPVVETMLSVARVAKNDTLFDLGSGDGRIVITAAKRFGTRGIGIDIDPQRIKESRHNADTAGVTRLAEFREADLFQTDLRSATVITLYLLPRLNVRLRPKLFEELRPGTRVVSHSFDMGDWEADSIIRGDRGTVYYWVMPANVAGTWTLTAPGEGGGAARTYELTLQQQYQKLTGTATAGGRSLPVMNGEVSGTSLTFTLGDSVSAAQQMRFSGRIEGNAMSGGGSGRTWRATRRATR